MNLAASKKCPRGIVPSRIPKWLEVRNSAIDTNDHFRDRSKEAKVYFEVALKIRTKKK